MTTSAENAAAVATEKTATTAAAAPGPEKRRALGRGLDSLLPAGPQPVRDNRAGPHEIVLDEVHAQAGSRARVPAPHVPGQHLPAPHTTAPHMAAAQAQPGEAVVQIPLEQIAENPYQTRYFFNEDALEELAESIKASGVVQPVVVRAKEGQYVLVLGERRLRASKLAGKATIPAIIRAMSEQQAAETTVVENLQRQDLNCMEQAAAFAKLSQGFKLTQEQIGNRVGLSRESVSNYMRLLKLPGTVMQYLQEGKLGFSEARVLLRLEDPQLLTKVADDAVRKRWSVDELEEVVFNITVPVQGQQQPEGRARWVDPNVRAAQRELETILGVRVRIRDRKGKGKIVIEYATLEDYDRVLGMLRGKQAS